MTNEVGNDFRCYYGKSEPERLLTFIHRERWTTRRVLCGRFSRSFVNTWLPAVMMKGDAVMHGESVLCRCKWCR